MQNSIVIIVAALLPSVHTAQLFDKEEFFKEAAYIEKALELTAPALVNGATYELQLSNSNDSLSVHISMVEGSRLTFNQVLPLSSLNVTRTTGRAEFKLSFQLDEKREDRIPLKALIGAVRLARTAMLPRERIGKLRFEYSSIRLTASVGDVVKGSPGFQVIVTPLPRTAGVWVEVDHQGKGYVVGWM